MKKRVALVLSGGGARGTAHIGAIEVLEEQGFEISSIAGTSMGALVGGVYALGKLQEYKEWMFSLDRTSVFNLVDFTLSRHGLVKGDRVFNKMKDFIPDTDIENLKIPFAAVAADLVKREEVVFTSGSIYQAIRASVSIPTVLTPVESEDRILVDGGVLNNIPVDHVKRRDGDLLVVVNVNANIPVKALKAKKSEIEQKERAYQSKIKEFQSHLKKINPLAGEDKMGYFDIIDRTISTMTYRIAQLTLENYSPDIIINVSRASCGTFDFFKAEEMVDLGRDAANRTIIEFKKSNV